MDALAELWIRIRQEVRRRPGVSRRPVLASIVGSEDTCGRDADVETLRVRRVELDRMAAHASGARMPPLPGRVGEQPFDHLPGRPAIVRAEEDAGGSP